MGHWTSAWVAIGLLGCADAGTRGTGGQGLTVRGVLAYEPRVCAWQCGGAHQFQGAFEIGEATTVPNTYDAIIDVAAGAGAMRGGPIQLVGATIRFEYPTLGPALRRGTLLPVHSSLSGSIDAADGRSACAAVAVQLVDQPMARELADDTDVEDRLQSDRRVPILAHVVIEGRSGTGGRISSSELTYEIDIVPAGALYYQTAPPPDRCTGAAYSNTSGTVACPTGTRPIRQSPCFPGQDYPETCVCQ